MKKTFRLILLLILSALLATSVIMLAACNREEDPAEFVEGQGNTIKVVLNSTLDPLVKDSVDKISNGYIDYRLKSGSPIPEPGKTRNTTAPVAEGYIFEGWYECRITPDGTVVYVSNEKWDFNTKVTESVTLYGKWLIQYKIRINYLLNGEIKQHEDVNVSGNAAQVNSIKEPSWTGNTFIQMYEDEACSKELTVSASNPFTHGCTQENPIREVYAQFMEGRWELIRNATDMRTISEGSNLYFFDDVDLSTLANKDGLTGITIPTNFKGTIEGNGHTISNLNFVREGTTGTAKPSNFCLGMFSRLNGATIRNVTFKDCTVQGVVKQLSDEYYYGFIAGQTMGECTFENITFDNCTLKTLLFDVPGGLTPEKEAAEREKIEDGVYVGDGSDFHFNVVGDAATQTLLAQLSKIQALEPKLTNKFC